MTRRSFGAAYARVLCVVVSLTVLVGESRSSGQSPAPRPARVSVSGRVIDQVSGTPVAGAVVRMGLYVSSRFSVERFTNPAGETLIVRADMAGQFAFDEVSAGTYWLSTTVPGFVGGVYSQRHPLSEGATFEVSDRSIANVTLRVWKGAAIEGAATDDRGVPASGAEVQILPRTFVNGRGRYSAGSILTVPGARGTTDANGHFRIDGLAPFDYILTVRSTTPTRRDDGVALFPIAFEPDPPVVPMTLTAGQEHRVTLILRPAPVARVTGTFVGPDGPIAGASVTLYDARLRSNTTMLTGAMTDATGRFVMPQVAAGEYVVVASRTRIPGPPGTPGNLVARQVQTPDGAMLYADANDEVREEYRRQRTRLTAEAAITVGQQGSDVPLVALAGGGITGKITFIGSEKPAAQLIRRMVVLAESIDDNLAPSSTSSLVSESGEFAMSDVRLGRYQLRIAPPTPSWAVRSVVVNGRDLRDAPVEVDGRETTEVLVEFANDKTEVAGTIRDLQTRTTPRAGTAVLFPEAIDRWVANGMSARYLRTATVDARGAYRIEQVLAGDYLLAAFAGGDYVDLTNPETFTRLARTARRISVRTGEIRTEDMFVD